MAETRRPSPHGGLLRLLLVLCATVAANVLLSNAATQEEVAALNKMKDTLGPANLFVGWVGDPCTGMWLGVICDAPQNVIGINFESLNVDGTLADDVSRLTSLQILNLASNQFTGKLPKAISTLTNLQHLDVSNNKFEGKLPDAFSQLTALRHLDASQNSFVSELPASLSALSSVTYINLAKNKITGSLPDTLTGLSELTYLSVADNSMSGKLPASLGTLAKLSKLDLSNNAFTGAIPSTYSAIPDLITTGTSLDGAAAGAPASAGAPTGVVDAPPAPAPAPIASAPAPASASLPAPPPAPPSLPAPPPAPPSLPAPPPAPASVPAPAPAPASLPVDAPAPASLLAPASSPAPSPLLGSVPAPSPLMGSPVPAPSPSPSAAPPSTSAPTPTPALLPPAVRPPKHKSPPPPKASPPPPSPPPPSPSPPPPEVSPPPPPPPPPSAPVACGGCAEGQVGWAEGSEGSGQCACVYPLLFTLRLGMEYSQFTPEKQLSLEQQLETGFSVQPGQVRTQTTRAGSVVADMAVGPVSPATMLDQPTVDRVTGILYGTNGSISLSGFGSVTVVQLVPPNQIARPEGTAPPQSPPPAAPAPSSSSGGWSMAAIIGVAVAGFVVAVLLVVALVVLCMRCRPSRKDAFQDDLADDAARPAFQSWANGSSAKANGGASSRKSQGVPPVSLAELQMATDDFAPDRRLGTDPLGTTFVGTMPDGTEVAVKKIEPSVVEGQSDEDFVAVAANMARLRHAHVVQLQGYCVDYGERILVFQHCAGGSLYDHLHRNDDDSSQLLSWDDRVDIALDAAEALVYLHEECMPPMVHRSISSRNVLLDSSLRARVAGAGLSFLNPVGTDEKSLSDQLVGGFAYNAPEYAMSGIYTAKSDVYSFGVVLLELLTGRKPVDSSKPKAESSLVRWAAPLLHDVTELEAMLDQHISGPLPDVSKLTKFAEVITRCIQPEPEFRPLMSKVVNDLNKIRGERRDDSSVALFYAPLVAISRQIIFGRRVLPRPAATTPVDQFSEERAMAHVTKLAGDIGDRQEGTQGLTEGARYILDEVERLRSIASPRLRVEMEESSVSGSFSMVFLQRSLSLAYQNLTNVVVRISNAATDPEAVPSVLMNGHFDSALGSPGAGDCATCVAAMLEVLRLYVEADRMPTVPLIFLFNGGEEVFMKASHGFITRHHWSETVGAVVNFEAAGTALPEMVVQSGPVFWPQRVYGETAVYPSSSVVCLDIFPHIPGDDDYRMFSHDFDDVPSLDSIYLLGGTFYHTSRDSPENVMPGALQLRGENLLPLLEGLSRAPELKTRAQRRMDAWSEPHTSGSAVVGGGGAGNSTGASMPKDIPVFFDLFNMRMVMYPRAVAAALNVIFLAALYFVPSHASEAQSGLKEASHRSQHIRSAFLAYTVGWLLSLIVPMLVAALRVAVSGRPMSWFAQPVYAQLTFIPGAVLGLLLPHYIRAGGSLSNPASLTPHQEVAFVWSSHWGCLSFNVGLSALVMHGFGGSGGFINWWWAFFMLPALFLYTSLQATLGKSKPLALLGYLLPGAFPAAFSTTFTVFFLQFMSEKMGATGTPPLPFGPFLADVVLAACTGFCVCLIMAPYAALLSRYLARPAVLHGLLLSSLLAAALTSQLFPYDTHHPKRVLMQRVYRMQGGKAVSAETTVATGDSNDATFLLHHVPRLARSLGIPPASHHHTNRTALVIARPSNLLALYPVSSLLDRPLTFPAPLSPRFEDPDFQLPSLRLLRQHTSLSSPQLGVDGEWRGGRSLEEMDEREIENYGLELDGEGEGGGAGAVAQRKGGKRRRIHLELAAGSLSHVWSAVLNITGPVTAWSLTPTLPARERVGGGPPSLMVHYSGAFPWQLWLEVKGRRSIHVDLAVLDHEMDADVAQMKSLLPDWTAPIVSSSYVAHYTF
ncbi:unnamed protein product [Closterium sp. NIES-65]|nr:unnamed protein product [Closterium sp. NIES-65]